MRISKITIKKLFGMFNHEILLNMNERITIIHAPNGFGKTILLKMIYGLFNKKYFEIRKIPFTKFKLEFENNESIWVEKENIAKQQTLLENYEIEKDFRTKGTQYEIKLFHSESSSEPLTFPLQKFPKHVSYRFVEREIPGLIRIDHRQWLYEPTQEIFSSDELFYRFNDFISQEDVEEPEWWREFQNLIDVNIIETQRLFIPHSSNGKKFSMEPAVEKYSGDLVTTISNTLAESATLSQSLDATFPKRVVENIGKSNYSIEELSSKLDSLGKKREKLKEVGLLEKDEEYGFLPMKLDDKALDVLTVHVHDVEIKLSVFDKIAPKIELLQTIINKRFQNKKIIISKKDGYTFVTSNNKQLPLSELSSGEQHELVLLHQLLFLVRPNSLILIDEPELSLHVSWQLDFLKDLQEITKLALFDVLIATHSPQIIHDRWDLTVELKQPVVS